MPQLLNFGVSLFLVDRISGDLRRMAGGMSSSARQADILRQKMDALNRSVSGERAATSQQAHYNNWMRQHNSRIQALANEQKQLEHLEHVRGVSYQRMEERATKPITLYGWKYKGGDPYSQMALSTMHEGLTPEEYDRLDRARKEYKDLIGEREVEQKALKSVKEHSEILERNVALTNERFAVEEKLTRMQESINAMDRQEAMSKAQRNIMAGMVIGGVAGTAGGLLEHQVMSAAGMDLTLAQIGLLTGDPTMGSKAYNLAAGLSGEVGIFGAMDIGQMMQKMLTTGMSKENVMINTPMFVKAAEALKMYDKGEPNEIVSQLTQMSQATGITDPKGVHEFTEKVVALVSKSPASLSTFAGQYMQILPALKGLGLPYDEALELSAVAERMGARGGFSPALLSTFFSRIGAPVGKSGAAMKALHINRGMSVEAVGEQLQKDFEDNPEKFAALAMVAMGGVRGIRTATSIGSLGPTWKKEFGEVDSNMRNWVNNPIEMAQATFIESLSGRTSQLRTNMETLATTIGRSTDPAVTNLIKHLGAAADKANQYALTHKSFAASIPIAEAGLFAGGSLAAGGLTLGAMATMAEWGALGAALSMGGIVAGAIAITTTGGILISDYYSSHPDNIKGALPGAISGVMPFEPGALSETASMFWKWFTGSTGALPPNPTDRPPKTDTRSGPILMGAKGGDVHIHIDVTGVHDDRNIASKIAKEVEGALGRVSSVPAGVGYSSAFGFDGGYGP